MASTDRRRVLFLMDRWLSSAGGIQTVNRKLACALAALDGAIECVAVIMSASDDEVEEAARNGVTLIRGKSGEDWTSVLLLKEVRGLDPSTVTAVVGHSHFSGPQALHLRDNLFPNATAVQFVHMSPMHTEALKEYRRDRYVVERERRLALELSLAGRADIVACVGPRLYRYMNQQLVAAKAKPRVVRVNCGFERVETERSVPEQPTVLCMGRADSMIVKGLDIFAIAAGELTKKWLEHPATNKRPTPEFIVRGAKEEPEHLQSRLVELSARVGDIAAKIHVRPYTTRAEELNQDLRAASVFVMPSREEGFGLVACEALSRRVPVVITSESGLAETIREMSERTGQDVSGTIVHHASGDEMVAKAYAQELLKTLVDERTAGQRAHQMFEHLLTTNSWEEAAKTLRDSLVVRAPAASSAFVSVPSSALPLAGSNAGDAVAPIPAAAAAPAPSGAAAGSRAYDVTETLKRHDALLRSPGIVTFVVRHALVVFVEDGTPVTIPDKLDDIDVVVRKIDKLRFSSLRIPRSGDLVIYRGGQGLARVGMWVTDEQDNLLLTTVAHAVDSSPADARVEVRSEATGELLPASVARWDRAADVALLAVPSASVTRSAIALAEPTLELQVRFVLPGRTVAGVISGVAATLHFSGVDGVQSMTDLFEVRVVEGALETGDSGCIIVDSDGRPVGFLVAMAHEFEAALCANVG
ncbi:glycosyltransferase [Sorangium sp. So ce295]|uniref:glycosyltransferase n=1 Tax=Sorangium sp. So ce295 TaxID=3133295 RepID=UPI003F62022B